ncbi:hypothetical protein [Exiguobacterium sp. TDN 0502]|uniref:hypothetical protein n=1 Tax=Exiguobacterium sp. TDN 0502 TaxID=3420731 RepID=UPI003D78828B
MSRVFLSSVLIAFLYASFTRITLLLLGEDDLSFVTACLIGFVYAFPVILTGSLLSDSLLYLTRTVALHFTTRLIVNQAVALLLSLVLIPLVLNHSFSSSFVLFTCGVALICLLVSEMARTYPASNQHLSGWFFRIVLSYLLFSILSGSIVSFVPTISRTEQMMHNHADALLLLFVSGIGLAEVICSFLFSKRSLPWTSQLYIHIGIVCILAGSSYFFTSLPVALFFGNVCAALTYVLISRLFIVMKTGKEEYHDSSVISTCDE